MEKERNPNDTIKVLLADDHTMFRQGLAEVLDDFAGMEVVGKTNNDEGAVELARLTKPDVVLNEREERLLENSSEMPER